VERYCAFRSCAGFASASFWRGFRLVWALNLPLTLTDGCHLRASRPLCWSRRTRRFRRADLLNQRCIHPCGAAKPTCLAVDYRGLCVGHLRPVGSRGNTAAFEHSHRFDRYMACALPDHRGLRCYLDHAAVSAEALRSNESVLLIAAVVLKLLLNRLTTA